jgi:hypothetical protein
MSCCLRTALVSAVILWLAIVVDGAGARAQAAPVLTLSYGASHTLTVTTAGGSNLTAGASGQVPPGVYQVVISDDASDETDPVHMFQLSGPGLDLMTDLQGGDDKSELYTETLAPNATYTFQDDDQPSLSPVVFTTTSTPAPAGPTLSSPTGAASTTAPATPTSRANSSSNSSIVGSATNTAPLRGTLAAAVSANGTLTLSDGRKPVTSLKEGRYRLVVNDRSTKVGFIVQEKQQPAHTLTGGPFVGQRTSTLTLQPGQWFFYSTFTDRKTYFIVVA